MADRIDILLDTDNDLKIYDGDFMTGAADLHHAEVVLISAPGSFKQYPLIGANIRQMISGKLDVEARMNLKLHLASDGIKAKKITIEDNALTIEL